MKGKVGLS